MPSARLRIFLDSSLPEAIEALASCLVAARKSPQRGDCISEVGTLMERLRALGYF